jgi:hypothetical protein
VTNLLVRLDRDRRGAFVSTQLLGLSYAEAADVAGCPAGTIRSRVARARAHLVDSAGCTWTTPGATGPPLRRRWPVRPGHLCCRAEVRPRPDGVARSPSRSGDGAPPAHARRPLRRLIEVNRIENEAGIIQLTPTGGFAARTVASSVMVTTATVFAVPVSTTHITTTSIMGAASTRRLSAVRWTAAVAVAVAGNIVVARVVPLRAAAAAAFFLTDLAVG